MSKKEKWTGENSIILVVVVVLISFNVLVVLFFLVLLFAIVFVLFIIFDIFPFVLLLFLIGLSRIYKLEHKFPCLCNLLLSGVHKQKKADNNHDSSIIGARFAV